MDGKDGSETIGLGDWQGKNGCVLVVLIWDKATHVISLSFRLVIMTLKSFPLYCYFLNGVCSWPFKQLKAQRYSVWQWGEKETEAGLLELLMIFLSVGSYTNCLSYMGPFWETCLFSVRCQNLHLIFSSASFWYFIHKKAIIEFYSVRPEGWQMKAKLHNDSIRPVLSTSLELWSSCLHPLYIFVYIINLDMWCIV